MSDIIKMNYPLMQEMAQAFAQGTDTLETTVSEMNAIANLLAEGALLGMGGASFEDATRGTLIAVLQRLQEKFVELQGDVTEAMGDMQSADSDTTRFYT